MYIFSIILPLANIKHVDVFFNFFYVIKKTDRPMSRLMESNRRRLETCATQGVAHALPIPKGRGKKFKEEGRVEVLF